MREDAKIIRQAIDAAVPLLGQVPLDDIIEASIAFGNKQMLCVGIALREGKALSRERQIKLTHILLKGELREAAREKTGHVQAILLAAAQIIENHLEEANADRN